MVVSKLKVLREARQLRATRLNLMKRSRWDTETWGGGGGRVQALTATFTPDAFQPGGGNLPSLSPDCDYEA